jgi:hypothetical protein
VNCVNREDIHIKYNLSQFCNIVILEKIFSSESKIKFIYLYNAQRPMYDSGENVIWKKTSIKAVKN